MKKVLFALLLLLSSCFHISESKPQTTTGYLVSSKFEPAHSEYTYHWGYNFINGKYCWHWGYDDVPDKYNTTIICFNDTITLNSVKLYNKVMDTFTVIYKDRYRVNRKDSVFISHDIYKIVIENDTLDL